MKAYKVTLLVIDHNEYGPEEIKVNIENEEYTSPRVIDITESDIGEWHDGHPLNGRELNQECYKYFK